MELHISSKSTIPRCFSVRKQKKTTAKGHCSLKRETSFVKTWIDESRIRGYQISCDVTADK